MVRSSYPIFVAGEARTPNQDLEVRDKYSGEVVSRVPLAGPDLVEEAIAAATEAAEAMAALPAYRRRDVLRHCVAAFEGRRDELATALCVEAGKPIRDAEGEVQRLIETFDIAAEEATRIRGEVLPLDIAERTAAYRGMTKRVPVGPCAFITPFNFPLNLVAHKVAPAIACGCSFVLKPTRVTPIGALLIGEVLAGAGLPAGAFSIVPCTSEAAVPLVADDRLRLLSFTGSDAVGKKLAQQARMKHVVLELGGNAACVVDEGVDLDDCVERLVFGAYYQSGQSCISVQRILAHASVYSELRDKLAERVRGLRAGDPKDRETFIGPMIDEKSAERLAARIASAVRAGATVLAGGERDGSMHAATLVEGVPPHEALSREEAFGPVAVLDRFEGFDAALEAVNDSRFGLQAGVFTNDLRRMHRAWDRLRVGGVVINDVPSFRVDSMPYGGVKDSGLGREGVRDSIAHMTEQRLLVVRQTPRG